jgi:hypothetical protein
MNNVIMGPNRARNRDCAGEDQKEFTGLDRKFRITPEELLETVLPLRSDPKLHKEDKSLQERE